MTRATRIILLFTVLVATASGSAAQNDPYKTYREAAAAGAKAIRAGDLAAARGPLEAATRLATTDREKVDAHRALLVPYRELTEVEPMQKAAEYVIAHTAVPAERSTTRSALLSFIQKRGKMNPAIEAYEARLKKDPGDRIALYLLTEAHATYKKDYARAMDYGEKLAAVEKKAGRRQEVTDQAKLADLYVRAGKPKEGAELYEAVAASDKKLEAWHRKEAAAAWLKAGDKAKALAAARKSAAAAPESRSEQLSYFWRRGLGDVLLEAGAPAEAIAQYEQALSLTRIEGYIKDTKDQLAKAKAAAGK
jgi:hypothetical protein